MSKERLEEIRKDVMAEGFINEKDFWYLYEQAERVQSLKIVLEILGKQNKRYREALEEIMRTETVTTALAEGQVAHTFSGHIARQVLEACK